MSTDPAENAPTRAQEQVAMAIDVLTAWTEYQAGQRIADSFVGERLNYYTADPIRHIDLTYGLVQAAAAFLLEAAAASGATVEEILRTTALRYSPDR